MLQGQVRQALPVIERGGVRQRDDGIVPAALAFTNINSNSSV